MVIRFLSEVDFSKSQLKKKTFIFDELKYYLLPLAIFLKLFGHKIYFLKLSKIYQKEKYINFLKFLKISWLNYQDCDVKKTKENC